MKSLVVLAGLLGVVAVLSRPPRWQHQWSSATTIPDARLVRGLSKPIRSLVTDLYWLRVIAASTKASQPPEGLQVIQWAEFVTDLEPSFYNAYLLGGLLGAMPVGDRIANAREAEQLLAKGMQNVPRRCQLSIYRAWIRTEGLHDSHGAAEALSQGARNAPDCPPFVPALATRLYASTGDIDSARSFAQAMEQSDDPETAEAFRQRLQEIEIEAVLQKVDQAARDYHQRFGSTPPSVDALLQASLLSADDLRGLPEPVVLEGEKAWLTSHRPRLTPFIPKPE